MTDFLKTWLNAAAAAINASTGIPYAPVPADMRDDLFSRAEAVRAAGGSVIAEPMGVAGAGRMAFFTDAEGAPLTRTYTVTDLYHYA